jgi:hypothetical protein
MHVDRYRLSQLNSCSINNRAVVSVSVLPSRSRLSQSPVSRSRSSPCRLFLEIGHALPCLNSRGLVSTKTGGRYVKTSMSRTRSHIWALKFAHVVPGAAVHVDAKAMFWTIGIAHDNSKALQLGHALCKGNRPTRKRGCCQVEEIFTV